MGLAAPGGGEGPAHHAGVLEGLDAAPGGVCAGDEADGGDDGVDVVGGRAEEGRCPVRADADVGVERGDPAGGGGLESSAEGGFFAGAGVGEDAGAALPGECGGAVVAAVIDDQHVESAEVVEQVAEPLRLVAAGDDHREVVGDRRKRGAGPGQIPSPPHHAHAVQGQPQGGEEETHLAFP